MIPTAEQLHHEELTTNCSRDCSKSSLFTPKPPGCSAGDNGFFTTKTIKVRYDQRVFQVTMCLHTIFHEEVDIDLLKRDPHTRTLDIGKHHELDIGRRLVVVKLVLTRPIRNKARLVSTSSMPAVHNPELRTCHRRPLISAPCCAGRRRYQR